MSSSNGNGTTTGERRRVLVIGGQRKNVPVWAERAFDIDLIEGDHQGGNKSINPDPADAIVVAVNWVSHNFSGQAHELGRKWGVPVLKARNGWASAVKGAAMNRLDWFVDAVQVAGESLETKNMPRAIEAVEAVENAWKDAALIEREKAQAAEKRVRTTQRKLEKVESALERVRSGAQDRVIAEVRRRAADVRKQQLAALEPILEEIRSMREASSALTDRLELLERQVEKAVGSKPETA